MDIAEKLAMGSNNQGGEDDGGEAEDEGEQCHQDDGQHGGLLSYLTPERFHNHNISKYRSSKLEVCIKFKSSS